MISRAKGNFQRISPRKARIIVDLVRGRDAFEALQLLDFTPKAAAPIVKKLIASALANARVRQPDLDVDTLFISKAASRGRTRRRATGPRAPAARWNAPSGSTRRWGSPPRAS
jgi:ribosomal protein L22